MVNSKGGEAVGRGSYGCVFRPALKCRGFNEDLGKYVSKLMCNKEANQEMQEIDNIINIIYNIPNNKEYFIPNKEEQFFKCNLEDIDKSNLKNSNICVNFQRCSESDKLRDLFKDNFSDDESIQWIVNNKKNLTIIQQPDGGEEFAKFIRKEMKNSEDDEIKKISKILINLMKNGIKLMNEEGLLHLDIKPENLVIKDDKIRIIDWGLSINTKNKNFNVIKRNMIKHTLQFNILISNILFDDELIKYLHPIKIRSSSSNTSIEISNHINDVNNQDDLLDMINFGEEGHSNMIINYIIFLRTSVKFEDEVLNIMNSYYKKILNKYIKINNNTLKFDEEKFYNEVYKHNVDIYSIFVTFVTMMRANKIPVEYVGPLKELCYKYMFSEEYAAEKYDVKQIENELDQIFGLNLQLSPIDIDKVNLADK